MANEHHDHDQGLRADLVKIQAQLKRRSVLRLLGLSGVGLAATACGGGGGSSSSGTTATATATATSTPTATATATSTSSGCIIMGGETEGPYPADGSNSSNGVVRNVLATSGVVRADIRSSFGGVSTNTAAGVKLTLAIQLVNTSSSCAPLAGYAIYIWHCTQGGQYSLYDLPNENYLRGVLVTDSTGTATFTTIFPGCYSGRWPHIHFEIYPSLPVATSYVNKKLTSQLAMPAAVCSTVYNGASGYTASIANFSRISIASDNVFGDNSSDQIAAMTPSITGDITNGFTATAVVGILPS